MNKIKVVNDNLELSNVNKHIEVEYYKKECLFAINDLRININKDSDLDIEIDLKEDSKLNFNINISSNVKLNLNINTVGKTGKIQYKYTLSENSICNVSKFQNIDSIKEIDIVKNNEICMLNCEYARYLFEYDLSDHLGSHVVIHSFYKGGAFHKQFVSYYR